MIHNAREAKPPERNVAVPTFTLKYADLTVVSNAQVISIPLMQSHRAS